MNKIMKPTRYDFINIPYDTVNTVDKSSQEKNRFNGLDWVECFKNANTIKDEVIKNIQKNIKSKRK